MPGVGLEGMFYLMAVRHFKACPGVPYLFNPLQPTCEKPQEPGRLARNEFVEWVPKENL